MSKTATTFAIGALAIDRARGGALHKQLYDALREAMLSNRLKAGVRLPSTRMLAGELGLSRNTVATAFEQLTAEGYISARVGDGSYVSASLPDAAPVKRAPARAPATQTAPSVSRRYRAVTSAPQGGYHGAIQPRPFRTGLAALDEFPARLWARLLARRMRNGQTAMLIYGDAMGYRPLREAIASYLGSTRGLRCTPDQIVITAASQEAINLAAQVLLDEGDEVWMEDPGYQGARSALLGAGAIVVPVPVDADGLQVAAGMAAAPQARMAYVTPSYQYPLGVTLSLSRRLALLDWARRANAWILEDDYNSEYRFTGRPLAALHGLDTHDRVIYVGTFSKVMFGALRVGYLVVPPQLSEIFATARTAYHLFLSTLDQAVLCDFITEGHFAAHIRRMRALYATRRALLEALLARECPALTVECAPAGLHVTAWLPPGYDDRAIARAAARRGIEAQALSDYALAPPARGGLVLGYGAFNERMIHAGVRALADAIKECPPRAANPARNLRKKT